jgi:HEPN domain-containing protein
MMAVNYQEWLKQADYDMDTAEYMLKGGRCFYAVFMCHLSIEKALKGLYHAKQQKVPPKTHNLMSLLDGSGVEAPDEIAVALSQLNEAHLVTRYPDELDEIQKAFTKTRVRNILATHKKVLKWIKAQF